MKSRVFDCFTFFNELDLLEIRLNTLNAVVNRFVIAEATRTHSGKPKELLFEKNRSRYAAFADKITYVVVDDLLPEEEVAKDAYNLPWVNENRQRNALIRGLADAKDDDVIMVSDLDEIPRPEKIAEARAFASEGGIVRFVQRIYMYFANFRSYRDPWWFLGTQMMSFKTFKTNRAFDVFACDRFTQESENSGSTMTKARFVAPTRKIPDAGWHWTYLGGIEAIKTKLQASSHVEVQNVIARVEDRLSKGENIFGGKRDCFADSIDDSFPQFLIDNRQRFSHLLFEIPDGYFRRTAWLRRWAWIRGVSYRFCVGLVPKFLVAPLVRLKIKLNFR